MLNCKRELDMNPLVSTAVAWVRPATKYAHLAAIHHALILSGPVPCRNGAIAAPANARTSPAISAKLHESALQ